MRTRSAEPLHGGFILIELLIVVVIIGLLASIAIPKFSSVREKPYVAAVTSDLKLLANQMEIYQSQKQSYPNNVSLLVDFTASDGVTLTINEANLGQGWAATGFHSAVLGRQCGIYYGNGTSANATPATSPGVVTCN